MLTAIEYMTEHDGVMICRCWGTGNYLQLPETVAGQPVTALADHCFAREPSFQLRRAEKKYAVCSPEDGSWQPDGAENVRTGEPLCADGLKSIVLPPTLLRIGNYAFYGCHDLEEVHFPASLVSLGGGAFVAAYHLQRLYFSREKGQDNPPCMKDVLGDYRYEIEVIVEENGQEQYRLIFPEYYEEAIENTPGREIQMEFHGTGYKYRQCFRERQIDLQRYDSWFYTASVQEFLSTVMKLVFCRLRYPFRLSENAKEQYIAWLKKEYTQVARYIFREQQTDLLTLLERAGYFSEEILDTFIGIAGRSDHAEAVSILLEFKRKGKKPGKKKYAL